MANSYLEFSEAIGDITEEEKKWIEGIPDRGDYEDNEKYEDEDAWMKAYAEALTAYGISGQEMLDEGNIDMFPNFTCVIDTAGDWWLSTHDYEWGYPHHAAMVVQGFIKKFRPDFVFKLTWCEYCDKPRIGEFGGGWLVVDKDRVVFGNVWQAADDEAKAQS